MSERNRPTHIIRISNTRDGTPGWDTVGAIWFDKAKNQMNITLNRGVVLSWLDIHDRGCKIIALENRVGTEVGNPRPTPPAPHRTDRPFPSNKEPLDDDIPF